MKAQYSYSLLEAKLNNEKKDLAFWLNIVSEEERKEKAIQEIYDILNNESIDVKTKLKVSTELKYLTLLPISKRQAKGNIPSTEGRIKDLETALELLK